MDVQGEDTILIAAEMNAISQYLFRENMWFGAGHTINTSEKFREKFGYDYFLFAFSGFSTEIFGIGEVNYLILIPLYEQERDAIVENGDSVFLANLCEKYGTEALALDRQRDIVPAQ